MIWYRKGNSFHYFYNVDLFFVIKKIKVKKYILFTIFLSVSNHALPYINSIPYKQSTTAKHVSGTIASILFLLLNEYYPLLHLFCCPCLFLTWHVLIQSLQNVKLSPSSSLLKLVKISREVSLPKHTVSDFPGGPVVKTLRFHCRGHSSITGQGTKDPTFSAAKG